MAKKDIEVFNSRVINHYEIKKKGALNNGKDAEITLVCDGGSAGGLWGVVHTILTKNGSTYFEFKQSNVTRAIAELLLEAAEIMDKEPSD